MKIKQFTFYIILTFSTIYLISCSDTPHSQQYQDAILETVAEQEFESIFIIRNIKKVNGYMLDNFYFAVMTYDRLCLVNVDDAIVLLDQEVNSRQSHDLLDDLSKSLHSLASQTGLLKVSLVERFGEFKKGDVLKEKLTLQFLKTEQGWRLYNEK